MVVSVYGENHRPVVSHWQDLSHNVVSSIVKRIRTKQKNNYLQIAGHTPKATTQVEQHIYTPQTKTGSEFSCSGRSSSCYTNRTRHITVNRQEHLKWYKNHIGHQCTVKPAYVVTSIKQSHVLKGHFFLFYHITFHMNWTSFKRSPVLKDHFFFAPKVAF